MRLAVFSSLLCDNNGFNAVCCFGGVNGISDCLREGQGLAAQFDGTIDRRHDESRLRVTGRDDMLGE